MTRIHRRLRQTSPLAAALLLFGGLTAGPAAAQTYWFEDYQRAVMLIEQGRHAEASPLIDRMLRDHPLPVACMRIPGDRCIDYLPYFQRARIQLSTENLRGARHSLDIEGAFGAVLQNRKTERAFEQLRREVGERIAATESSARSEVVPAAAPR
jgi:hypothetical protein